MMNGWRRAFCTSVPKDRDAGGDSPENHRRRDKPASRFGFFSNPSTPRSETRPYSGSSLRCRKWAATAVATPSPSLPCSPKLQCRTTGDVTPETPPPKGNRSPVSLLSLSSNPSSPASFSLFKSKLCFNKSSSRCGICAQSVKAGQGTAIFTAECSHTFHFPCVASRAGDSKLLTACPVCGASWRQASLLSLSLHELGAENYPKPGSESESRTRGTKSKSLRIYNDDDPLISSPISLTGFNPIPESDENDDDDDEQDNGEFKGFFVNTPSPLTAKLLADPASRNVEVKLSPEAAIVAVSRGYETYSVVLKVKSPPFPAARGAARRAPVDLVTVLDVSGSMVGGKGEMLKRAMTIVISSLRETDRLSIVAFSSRSKRMSPLRRMTASGRRSARRIVDTLIVSGAGEGMSVNDALKKAAKVVEDRRQKNLFSTIFVLTGRHSDYQAQRAQLDVSSTRISQLDIPVHTIRLDGIGACNQLLPEDAFAKRVNSLLSLSVQDLNLELGLASGAGRGEITSVYSLSGRPGLLGSGSIRFGDMYADEEREVLVEVKGPSGAPHRIMTVRSRFVDPTSQEIRSSEDGALLVPRPEAVRSSNQRIAWLRNIHVSRRAVAESRRLMEGNDFAGAERMLTSARALLGQYEVSSGDSCLRGVEAELAELNRARGRHVASKGRDQVAEVMTPTSAWRAAERLARVAIMRKHLNRVSDLHGFENARF
ncbi:PREDICTED: uncharacterized protein LOC104807655 isoform X1 [Tarenaya hassleriana]|uniref:uncharacterized protein LOC104807655 isoform X1 n=1 Tax=Tarenaya hassleriana TaxID=28532 RepID=UPI00053C8712|nr:PREDICTED: uncharacterized protein LOC104807655 isoform X1 [Tarenaya hassleriana]